MELSTPHTTSTVSAPERHKQQNEQFSRKSASVDSWQGGGNKEILLPLDFGLQLSGFGALSLCKRKDLTHRGAAQEVVFKCQDYMTTKQLICYLEKPTLILRPSPVSGG